MTNARVQSILQPAGQRLARYAGVATPGLHLTPTFLICGAPTVWDDVDVPALRQHPAVLRPTMRKGVHYFDTASTTA